MRQRVTFVYGSCVRNAPSPTMYRRITTSAAGTMNDVNMICVHESLFWIDVSWIPLAQPLDALVVNSDACRARDSHQPRSSKNCTRGHDQTPTSFSWARSKHRHCCTNPRPTAAFFSGVPSSAPSVATVPIQYVVSLPSAQMFLTYPFFLG